jgi:lipopolysaccharide export system protein LptA
VKVKSAFVFAATLGFALCCRGEPVELANSTVITSKKVMFDYKRMVAEFHGSVVVVDPQIRIESDDLTVAFNSTNEVKSVTASGNVRMKQAEMTATCNKAVYTASEGKVILIGDAKIVRGKNSVASDEITYWFDEERMVCNKPGKVIVVPDKETRSAVSTTGSGTRKAK